MINGKNRQHEELLLEQNLGLILSIVKSYCPLQPDEFNEYIQLGRIGFLKAIRKHKKSGSASLSTYAWYAIHNEIKNHIIKEGNKLNQLVSLPKDIEYLQQEALWEYLPDTLTKEERTIFQLRYEGYTFREISKKLNKYSKNWVNKLYNSIIKKIQDANK